MSTIDIGNAAEQAVADELSKQGFAILARNWKTKWCEVDIIACKDNTVWFVEVKYRGSTNFGEGLEYIGHAKLRHLQVAATIWTDINKHEGEITLGAVSVTGDNVVGKMVEI